MSKCFKVVAYASAFMCFFLLILFSKTRTRPQNLQMESTAAENIVHRRNLHAKITTEMTLFGDIPLAHVSTQDLKILLEQTLVTGYLDDQNTYRIIDYAFMAANGTQLAKDPACLALHANLNFVSNLKFSVKGWLGSISLALFTPSTHFYVAILYIKHLRKCNSDIKNRVNWHLVYPAASPPPEKDLPIFSRPEFDCSTPDEKVLKSLKSAFLGKTERELQHPQNLLRNLARRHCRNDWVVCPDIDMVFPGRSPAGQSLYWKLTEFLKTDAAVNCSKCAFVLANYEIRNFNDTVPWDKRKLLEYIEKHDAQVYNLKIHVNNQKISNLEKWEELPSSGTVKIAYKVEYKPWYEPIYIAKQGSPKFDERYVGYGMTRNTQVLEMHLSGYEFYVLDTIFLCHLWGIFNSRNHSKKRNQEVDFNTKMFNTFYVRELAVKYDTDLSEVFAKGNMKFKMQPKMQLVVAQNKNESR